ncbi:MAG TPA: efflux RND transporter periplasmic adaptor subunit, partial [Longimicrobiales bacterium]
EGWVDHLYVDFTGAPVSKGQPLMTVYSPMLVSAQEELILARKLLDEAQGETAQANARDLLSAARRRLSYWDIPPQEIARIEGARTPQKTLTLRAPASGIVLEKNVFEGARIMPGMDLYKIADLSSIWIEGEVFEKDLSLIRVGTPARVTFEAYPGKIFEARVKYVYPTVSEQTRTGRIRIELRNPGLQLKPGMYANVAFVVPVHTVGLHVPRSAVLATGTRSIVFVRHGDGSLVPHEVTTGLAGGDHIEIISGLKAGDVVVASANFLVDAESNLGAAMEGMKDSARQQATSPAAMPGMNMPAPATPQHQH